MGKLFEKMYIGDPNKKDLTKKDIKKQTRVSLFFTVIRVRGLNLLWLNLLYALFLLPIFLVIIWALLHYGLTLNDAAEAMDFQDVMFYLWILFPCMLIAMPGTVGFTNVLHRWANDEHAWFSDFWTGIKKNWKQGLLVTVINYIVLVVMIYCAYFYYTLGQPDANGIVRLPMGIYLMYLVLGCILAYFMTHLYVFPMLVRYKLTTKDLYKFSFMLAFRNMLGSVVTVITFAAFIYLAMTVPYLMYTVPFVLLVLPYLGAYTYIGDVFNKQVFIDTKDY